MSTDFLHRAMADEVCLIGERTWPQIDGLMLAAYEQAMALETLGDLRQHDALSLMFEMTARLAAKATFLLGRAFPDSPPDKTWTTAMTDLQLRALQSLAELHAQVPGDRTVQ